MSRINKVKFSRGNQVNETMLNTLSEIPNWELKAFRQKGYIKPGVLASTLTEDNLLATITASGGGAVTVSVSSGAGVNDNGDLIEVESFISHSYNIVDVLNKTLFIKYLLTQSDDIETFDQHHNPEDGAYVKSQNPTLILEWRTYTPSADSDCSMYPDSIPLGRLIFSSGAYSFQASSGYRRIAMITMPMVGGGLFNQEFTPAVPTTTSIPISIQQFLACEGHYVNRTTQNPDALSTTDVGLLLKTFRYMILQSGLPTYFKVGDDKKDWLLTTDGGSGLVYVGASGEYLVDEAGHLLECPQQYSFTLASGETAYLQMQYYELLDSYGYRKDAARIVAGSVSPTDEGLWLSTVSYYGGSTSTILDKRRSLIMRSFLPMLEREKSGTNNEIRDVVKEIKIPMPIPLSVEEIVAESHGVTTQSAAIVPRAIATLQGTPVANIKVWIGDVVRGSRNSVNHKRLEFDMSTSKAKVGSYDLDQWVVDPPGYYYIVNEAETWISVIISNGTDYVMAEDDYPDDSATNFYICPYAKGYIGRATPYESLTVGTYTYAAHPYQAIPQPPVEPRPIIPHPEYAKYSYEQKAATSPVEPFVIIEGLALGSRYKIEVASVLSSDVITAYATFDYVVGYTIRLANCWDVTSNYLTAASTPGGLECTIPVSTVSEPDHWEVTYTVGNADGSIPDDPDPDNITHETMTTTSRNFKINAPPGRIVKVVTHAVYKRMKMRECTSGSWTTKLITLAGTGYIASGGASILINDKQANYSAYTGTLASGQTGVAGITPITNPVNIKRIHIFNKNTSAVTNFNVWVHDATAIYSDGACIQIGGMGGDEPSVAAGGDAQKDLDLNIMDRIKVTIENIGSGSTTYNLVPTVMYSEI